MKDIFRALLITGLALGFVPTARAAQAPPATAPLSLTSINDLFKESAALGKSEELVLGEIEELASAKDTFTTVNGAKDESEGAAMVAHNSAASAQCNQKDWTKPGYQQCSGLAAEDKAIQAAYSKHHAEYISRVDKFEADQRELRDKYKVMEARKKTVDGTLKGQRAFTDAVDKCQGYSTMEAQSQCMQKRWDTAGTPEKDYTIPDPKNITVVVPQPGKLRTPAEAIAEYLKNGLPKLRPSGEEKREPPPPGQ